LIFGLDEGVHYSIPIDIAVAVTPTGAALDLSNDSGGDVLVATIAESSNVYAGYRILISSANNSNFLSDSGSLQTVGYKASYDNAAVVLTTTPVVARNSAINPGPATYTSDFEINWTGAPANYADTYSDTLTFTIEAN
jgi:hypothetical protein